MCAVQEVARAQHAHADASVWHACLGCSQCAAGQGPRMRCGPLSCVTCAVDECVARCPAVATVRTTVDVGDQLRRSALRKCGSLQRGRACAISTHVLHVPEGPGVHCTLGTWFAGSSAAMHGRCMQLRGRADTHRKVPLPDVRYSSGVVYLRLGAAWQRRRCQALTTHLIRATSRSSMRSLAAECACRRVHKAGAGG